MNFWHGLVMGGAVAALQAVALRGRGPSMDWAPVVLFGPLLVAVISGYVFVMRGQRGVALGLAVGPLLVLAGLLAYASASSAVHS